MPGGKVVFEFQDVVKRFQLPQGSVMVLDHLNFTTREGEFIAIVGPSGAGKSTLLRLANGLVHPSEGQIVYQGKKQNNINLETGMVFQNFALLPWLSVQKNVELGLESRIADRTKRQDRASFYIEKVGLEGYEEAYPRELSGGMKQRVGLARALAVKPRVLLMDEPFSSLDVLTSINLRDELMDIWTDPEVPIHTVMMVTHMIEEAIELSDRILVLSNRPGKIVGDIAVTLPRPRVKNDPKFTQLVDQIFSLLA